MARRIDEEALQAIERVVGRQPEGMTGPQIADALESTLPRRTLQYRLKALVDDGRLAMAGSGRWARYGLPGTALSPAESVGATVSAGGAGLPALPPLSEAGSGIRDYVRQPVPAREPVGYDRDFLDGYRPNVSFYLTEAERAELRKSGETGVVEQPAGTHARQVLNRLLVDLSWNSSRMEGNGYSLLDATRLIELGEMAEGRGRRDAQMILNHKEAIEILVEGAEDMGFNRHTILNLHGALADNLLPDPGAPGRLRRLAVGIGGSVFHPLEAPQIIEVCFDRILAKASQIEDPFERAFFAMVQLPYLQPFDDVNKRVSRLAANIPLIRANLAPLSFEGVPGELYVQAILGVYELRRTELLRDLFIWAYGRSASRYAAARQPPGEPDPFRLRHRAAMRRLIGEVVRQGMDRRTANAHAGAWAAEHVAEAERERFREVVERELLSLHEGSFSRYRIGPSEFAAWKMAWNG